MGITVYEETHEFLKHALVERSFGFPTPVVVLCVRVSHLRGYF
jgi:hypothetical protein